MFAIGETVGLAEWIIGYQSKYPILYVFTQCIRQWKKNAILINVLLPKIEAAEHNLNLKKELVYKKMAKFNLHSCYMLYVLYWYFFNQWKWILLLDNWK